MIPKKNNFNEKKKLHQIFPPPKKIIPHLLAEMDRC